MRMHNPAHPGHLIADVLENGKLSIGGSIAALARHLGVTRAALSRVIHGKAALSADMALRLEDALGVKADLLLRIQANRDLWEASQRDRVRVARVVLDEAA